LLLIPAFKNTTLASACQFLREITMKSTAKLFIAVAAATTCLSGTLAQEDFVTPRTEWGHPDLQGVWNFASDIPMSRPSSYGEREFLTPEEVQVIADRMAAAAARAETTADAALANRDAPPVSSDPGGYNDFWFESAGIGARIRTSHIIYPRNGQVPARVEGAPVQSGGLGPDIPGVRPVRYVVGGIAKDGPEDRGLSERCIIGFSSGPPFVPSLYNNNVQIVQNRDHAVILTEMIHDARTVPLVEGTHIDDDIRLWSGDSRGHWEGDTLVVVTKNFSDLTSSFGNFGTAYDKLLTEKFTRMGPYTVDYEWTLEDPSTFTDKFTAIVSMTKVAGQLYEYGCHEGNYGMVNTLRGKRMEERLAAEQAQ
jgi:hypothetical protein